MYTHCQLLESFTWISLHVIPELETLSHNERFWVELYIHIADSFLHCHLVDIHGVTRSNSQIRQVVYRW